MMYYMHFVLASNLCEGFLILRLGGAGSRAGNMCFCTFSSVVLLICFGFNPWMTEKIEHDGVRMVIFK